MMDGMMDGGMSGWTWLVPAVVIAVIVVIVLVVVRLSRRAASSGPSARDVLDRRYAQGEMSRDEYLRRRDDLDS